MKGILENIAVVISCVLGLLFQVAIISLASLFSPFIILFLYIRSYYREK